MPQTLAEALFEKPFGLALSSGFFGFYAHAGFVAALEDAQLIPAFVTGSSAGALVGGLWSAGLGAATMSRTLITLAREDFWDPAIGLGLLRGRLFRERLDALLPTADMASAALPMALSVFDVWGRTTSVRSSGSIAAAIHASCALPMMFHPVWIDGRPHLDGGIGDRPGWRGHTGSTFVLAHHLDSRSNRPLKTRPNTAIVAINGLPRVTPFALTRGAHAFHAAREATRRALTSPASDVIRV